MKSATVVNQGSEQTIHLPDGFHVEGSQVSVKRLGRAIVLIPEGMDAWEALKQSLDQFTSDYMEDRGQPSTTEPENIFE